MDALNMLEQAITARCVTPQIVSAALAQVKAELHAIGPRLSSAEILATPLHQLSIVQAGIQALVPRPADDKPNKKEETE